MYAVLYRWPRSSNPYLRILLSNLKCLKLPFSGKPWTLEENKDHFYKSPTATKESSMILSERFGSLQEHFLSWMPWGSPWCYPSYILEDCEWVNRKKQKFEAWESTIYLLNLSLWSYLLCSQCRGESGTQISPRHHFRHSDAHDPRDEMCTIVLWIMFIPFAKSSKNHVPYPTYVLFLSVCSHKRMVQHQEE